MSGRIVRIALVALLAAAAARIPADWEPLHRAYGGLGVILSLGSPPPVVLERGPRLPADTATAKRALFSPRRLRRFPGGGAVLARILARQTRCDINRGARVIVDTTRADLARAFLPARSQTLNLRAHGAIRVVVWDGAHHLPSLTLRPDILILPLLKGSRGHQWVCHGRMQDAVPLEDLRALLRSIGWQGWVVGVSRLTTLAKADQSLDHLVAGVLRTVGAAEPACAVRADIGSRRMGGAWLYDGGSLVLDPGMSPKDQRRAIIAGKTSGARRVWAALHDMNDIDGLTRLCREQSLALEVVGYPLGAAHIVWERIVSALL